MRKCMVLCLIVFPIFIGGCASAGKKFNFENKAELKLTKTTSKEALGLLGQPEESGNISNKDGNFKVIRYSYAYADLSGATARSLGLEFKEDKLNAYVYSSGFKEDTTEFDYTKSENIKVGESTKKDVLELLGEPSGKALCPSTINCYAKKCETAIEIWMWAYTKKTKGIDFDVIEVKMLRVSFDDKGVVVDKDSEVAKKGV